MTTFALVGTGRWGKNYIKTIRNLSFCKLPDKFIKTRDYKDLFSESNIDGVIIATPASTHFQIAKQFLEKGFNVLIEKPMTTNYKDAIKLYKIAEKLKKIVMVGHIFLYNPAFLEVKKQINSIGKIKYISSESMDYGPIRTDISSLWDWAPHDISMAMELLGNLPNEVCAYGFNQLRPNTKFYDTCYLKLNFPNEIFVFINVSWVSPAKKRNMIIAGEKGTIIFDDTVEKKISIIRNIGKDRQLSCPPFSSKSPLSMEIESYVNLIKNTKNNFNLKMSVDIIKILEACEESIRTGGKGIKIHK